MLQLECLFLIQILVGFSKIQQLYFGDDEYQYFSRQAIVIQANETEIVEKDFSNIQNLIDNVMLFSKQLSNINRNLTIQQDFSIVITSLLYDNSAIDICFSKIGLIHCKYRAMNQLINDDLIIIDSQNYSLKTNDSICDQLYNVWINKFIIQCKSFEGLMIMLINNQSEIIDSITIKSIYNQQLKSISKDQYIIIYESFDSLCSLYVVQWSINTNDLQYENIIINGQDYSDSEIFGKINNIQFYDNNVLYIYFTYLILHLNLIDLSITTIYVSNSKENQYFQLISLSQIHSEMLIYLDDNLKNIYEIGNKEFRINPKFSKVEQVRYINQNIIIKFESLLYIVNNQYIQNVIQIEEKQFIQLDKLPFVLLFSKFENLQIVKINSFPFYLKFSPSSYLSVFWCFDMEIHDHATIYKINKLPQQTTIILENNTTRVKILDSNHSNYYYHYRRKIFGFPSQVTHYTDNQGVVENIFESNVLYSNLDKNTIILKLNQLDSHIKIIFHFNQTFTLYDDFKKIYLKHQYPFNFNKSQIFICKSQSRLIFLVQSTLYCYSYESEKIIASKIIFQKKINYFVQNQDQVEFYFENCTFTKVNLQNFQLNEINQTRSVNCTMNLPKDNLIIKIKPQLIDFLRQNSYTFSISFHNIIRVQIFVNCQNLIIFELIQNNILMKLYQDKIYYYQFLYQLPTYSFTIEQPLQYQTYQTMIAILAHNEQMDQFILIYDITYKKLNSLIKFIQVDPDCRILHFLSISKFYYIFQNQHRIANLDSVTVIVKSDLFKHHKDSYSLDADITLFLEPRFMFNEDSLNIKLTVLNFNQRLQILTENKLRYLIQNQLKVIPLNQIYGNIESVAFYQNGVTKRNLQSFILVDKLKCLLYQQKVCILDGNKIIIDAFGNQLNLKFNTSQIINQFSLFQFQNIFSIYTLDENLILRVHSYNLEGSLIESNVISTIKLSFESLYLNSFMVLGDFILFKSTDNKYIKRLFIIINNQIQQFYINGSSQFDFISIIKTPTQYFITFQSCCQLQDSEVLNFIILNHQFDIIAQTKISINNMLQNILSENEVFKFSLSEFVNYTDYVQIKLLICSRNLQCHYTQFQFDLQLNLLGIRIINILRYEVNQFLEDILFASTQFVILDLRKDSQQKYIYNLNQKNKYIIDSHQQIELKDLKIEKYNQTHFTAQQYSQTSEIQLFQLQNYYIPCLNTCDESIIHLEISNKVSQLNLIFENSTDLQILPLKLNLQQLIIIITGALIFFYLRKSKKNKQKNDIS